MMGSMAVGAEEFEIGDVVGTPFVSFNNVMNLEYGIVVFIATLTNSTTN